MSPVVMWATMSALVISASSARADAAQAQRPAWPDRFMTRLAGLAIVETLRADLLSQDNATLTLEHWCARHDLAPPSEHIVAVLDRTVTKKATPEQLRELAVARQDEVRYRRVRLSCGGHVVSEADNWYVPARLTRAMNDTLEHTETSFGRAVADLHFRRHTLSSDLLWHPLAKNWEMGPAPVRAAIGSDSELSIPHAILENRAILSLPDGTPFSEVVETYTSEVLAFPSPQ